MKTTTFSISRIALVITVMCIALSNFASQAQTMTITLKNGTVKTYHNNDYDSIRYVGGEFGTTTGIGVKIYCNGSTVSEDYLYSQMSSFVITGGQTSVSMPVISPNGGTFTSATPVTITCETAGATIYYTTDGSFPVSSNTAHTGTSPVTLTVSNTTTVRARAYLNNTWSDETTATFTISSATDNNVNANWKETNYNIPQSGNNATTSSATYGMAWRLEYPHINTDANSTVVVHATSQYGISLSLEFDKSQKANRWSCFTMHNGVPNNDVGRCASSFSKDDCIGSAYQASHDDYTDGNYTTSTTNLDGSTTTLFSRGHVCASEDRQSAEAQNKHTFLTSNIHPQYQQHNGGLWGRMEAKVQAWGYSSSFRDTLYVCKGATIADVTLDNTTTSGTIPYSEVQTKFGVTLTGSLVIPRYWYMAVLRLKDGQYEAMAYWTEQINSTCRSTTLNSCIITIDELERRTGIDFFCNLPDDIEAAVEATVNTSIWQ